RGDVMAPPETERIHWDLVAILTALAAVLGGWTGWCGNELLAWGNGSLFVLFGALAGVAGFLWLWLANSGDGGGRAGSLPLAVGLGGLMGAVVAALLLLPAVLLGYLTYGLAEPGTRAVIGSVLGALGGGLMSWSEERSRLAFRRTSFETPNQPLQQT